MIEETKDVVEESSTSLEGAIASSPEAEAAVEGTGQATPQQAETPTEEQQTEEQTVPYDRFREVNEERKQALAALQELASRQQQVVQQPQALPQDQFEAMIANKTPEEQVFWRNVRDIARQEAAGIQRSISPQIDAAKQEYARLRADQFFKEHNDVRQGSTEEKSIAQRISQGYDPEDAYRAVMWDKRLGQQQQNVQKQQQQRLAAKQKANVVSSSGVSQQSVPGAKENFKAELMRRMQSWDGTI